MKYSVLTVLIILQLVEHDQKEIFSFIKIDDGKKITVENFTLTLHMHSTSKWGYIAKKNYVSFVLFPNPRYKMADVLPLYESKKVNRAWKYNEVLRFSLVLVTTSFFSVYFGVLSPFFYTEYTVW